MMINKIMGIFWGLVLILGGVYALMQTLGYAVPQDPMLWAAIFAGISLISLVLYFAGGWRNWGALFPATIFGALAILMGLAGSGVENPAMVAPLFIGIGVPFLLAYIIDTKENWWAVIPLGVMTFLTLMLLAVERVPGEWIGAGLFFALAIAFFLVYISRRALWAAIVAYVMLVLGFMPLLGSSPWPELAGVLIFLAIGLPFLFVYLRWPERWWAIIPAGIMLTMGLVTASVMLVDAPEANLTRIANALIFVGTGLTFAVVWLRNHMHWAMWATILCAAVAVAGLLLPGNISYWPLAMIAGGAFLLYGALRRKPA